MHPPHDLNPNTSPERRATRSRWLGRSLVAAVLVSALVVATSVAVSAGGSSRAPIILNTEKVERAIEHSSLAQRGTHARVSCPSGVHQKKGLSFSCTAVVDRDSAPCCPEVDKRGSTRCCTAVVERGSTRFVVTELDGHGHVHYEAP
jgi:hypothetical protein